VGILRGFDPFMNLVVDESIEECRDGKKNNIGMVVGVGIFGKMFLRLCNF
jgi:small nuclear ribonucleoprotein (snRNP)-like protein